jgi:transposase
MSKGTHYPSEFKREAVKLAQSSDRPTSQIAAELGIKANTLYNWVSIAMKDKTTPTASTEPKSKHSYQDLERENKRLTKELKRAEMEREILKKAAAYFASQEL